MSEGVSSPSTDGILPYLFLLLESFDARAKFHAVCQHEARFQDTPPGKDVRERGRSPAQNAHAGGG